MAEKKEKRYVSDNAQLMEEWNWNKNIDLGFIPNEITIGSAKKIWWICDKGHEWQATPNNRRQGKGCPFCAGRQVFIGFNDLLSKEPDVADEWHPTQNGDLLPTQVSFGSNRRVWWQCKTCSNEWQTSVANRVRGTGCPNCAKEVQGLTKINRHIEKYGSFADRFPELIEEWDFSQVL